MRRGTTPTVSIAVNGVDPTTFKNFYIIFKQGDVEVLKSQNDSDIIENVIAVRLSQEDTLRFVAGKEVRVQLRAITDVDDVIASDVAYVSVEDILQEGVIE